MSISKKLRFEVFKRDGFRCVYCGKTPPDALLEIDHIKPKSKGGKDDINNYLTACFDCNRGKSNIPLTKIPSQLAENLKILKAKESQYDEYLKYLKHIERRIEKTVEKITILFESLIPGRTLADHFKTQSLRRFVKALPETEIIEALHITFDIHPKILPQESDFIEKRLHYFCGICWNKIREKQSGTDTLS